MQCLLHWEIHVIVVIEFINLISIPLIELNKQVIDTYHINVT